MSTYTIGEIAERSGFSASALRYYEGISLVVPSTRTDAGYRLYDDDTLARLTFIARAKQLGCTLEEITDLVGIWDSEACGPVQKRFHDLVTRKLADAERQIAELTELSEQLRYAAAELSGPAIDGPCSEDCACLAVDRALTPVSLITKKPLPIYDDTAPIACTASGDELPVRIEQIERMRAVLDKIERTPHGLLLEFPDRPDIDAELRQFAVDEKGCCQFWGFAVDAVDGTLTLRWDGPPDTTEFMDRLFAFFEGDEPLDELSGLL